MPRTFALFVSSLALAASAALAQPAPSVQTVASGLQNPWALAFLPDGRFLVTERTGQMRVVQADGQVGAPLAGVPDVLAAGQGGLLDVALDSDFARNRTLYFCFSEPGASGASSTALARARLADDAASLQDVRVIFSQQPKVHGSLHFGCRVVERLVNGKPDGSLFLTLGDRFSFSQNAQRLDNHHGKVVRVGKDGSVPADNPFAKQAGALPEIWSMGHRNSQGAALGPDGQLWIHEHGARGGDEINRPAQGANHGWPLVSFGVDYNGSPIGTGQSALPGLAAPLHHWTPSIAPSGMAFVSSTRYGAQWQGNLLVGALKDQSLRRLQFEGSQLKAEHTLLPKLGQRIRDVRQGPDGLIYLLTDSPRGQLLRLQPAPQ